MRLDIAADPAAARALPPEAYTDPALARLEAQRVFARSWQPVARLDQLAEVGAYVTAELAGEPLLIVRDADQLRGYFNVCPHRAGPLARGCGTRKTIQCGYHGWTYRLDGRLLHAPECGGDDGVDLSGVALAPIQVATWGPLVLAAIEPMVPAAAWLDGIAAPPATLRHVMRRDYDLACNWKVYVDNYLEGYHIPIVHPELHKELDYDAYRTECARWWSQQHAPLRATARVYRPEDQGGDDALYYWAFPNLMLNIYQGQLQTNVVVPLAPDRTRVVFEWFAAEPPADPATDETWQRLVGFSDLLQEQDTMICETVQRNLGSRGARRGFYAPRRETGVHHFHRLLAELVAAALVVLLVACGGGGGSGDDGDDDVGPDAAPPRVFGGDRQVELQVPAGFDPDQQYPLLLILHGYSANGLLQQAFLGLGDIALDGKAFVLAPDGVEDSFGNPSWNASPACCGDHGTDDVAYLGGVLDDVMAAWPIDPDQVFLTGHSNGHFMSYRMACERSDIISAIAGLAGSMISIDGANCDPANPVSVLHVHGNADETVSYEGEIGFPSAPVSTALWADLDGCAATTTAGEPLDLVRDLDGAETTTVAHDGCPGNLDAELWTIVGGSHIPNFNDGYGDRIFDWLQAHSR